MRGAIDIVSGAGLDAVGVLPSTVGGTSCTRDARVAMLPRMALATGVFSSRFSADAFGWSSGVKVTASVSPVRMGLVKSALFPFTRMVKVTRLVAGGGVNPTANSASLTFALPVPF